MYEILLTIHILAAVVWVGGGVALTILSTRFTGSDRGVVAEQFSWYGGTVMTGAAFVLLAAGIGLVLELEAVGFGDGWITIGLAGWVASAVIGAGMLGPLGKKAAAATDPAERDRVLDRLMKIARVDTLIVLLVVVDMTVKPGA